MRRSPPWIKSPLPSGVFDTLRGLQEARTGDLSAPWSISFVRFPSKPRRNRRVRGILQVPRASSQSHQCPHDGGDPLWDSDFPSTRFEVEKTSPGTAAQMSVG